MSEVLDYDAFQQAKKVRLITELEALESVDTSATEQDKAYQKLVSEKLHAAAEWDYQDLKLFCLSK
jgi:hypothetical protein